MIFKHHNQKQFICYHFSWIHTASSPQLTAHFFSISHLSLCVFIAFFAFSARARHLGCFCCYHVIMSLLNGHKNSCLMHFLAMTFTAHCSTGNFLYIVLSFGRWKFDWKWSARRKSREICLTSRLVTEKASSHVLPSGPTVSTSNHSKAMIYADVNAQRVM